MLRNARLWHFCWVSSRRNPSPVLWDSMIFKFSSVSGAGFHGEWGVWVMLHKGTSTLGCSHSLECLFGDSGRGMTMDITGNVGRHVLVLNCHV